MKISPNGQAAANAVAPAAAISTAALPTAALPTACGSPVESDPRTRDRVASSLLEHGPSTAAELAARLGLTPAGIRRHLDAMVAGGTVATEVRRSRLPRGRGRPARRFVLTDAGHRAGPLAYDALAVDALRYLREVGGEPAVDAFAHRRIAAWEARYAEQIGSLPLDDRPAALAAALAADGYASTVHDTSVGVQLCQHHCPVQHVAEEFPVVCEAETAAIARLTGRHVQRLATIARHDGVCTTHIPLTDVSGMHEQGPLTDVSATIEPDPLPTDSGAPTPGGNT